MNKYPTDRIPPQALDVEQAVLGALLLESDAIHKVTGIINADSFYLPANRTIYEAVKRLADLNRPIDLLTVTRELIGTGKIEEIGGATYITETTRRVASAAHITYHARIIAQTFLKRELIRIGSELVSSAFDQAEDIEETIAELKRKISTVEDFGSSTNSGTLHFDACKSAIIEMERDCQRIKDGLSPGITTGLKMLDNLTGGWRNTNLVILAARPAVGKTSLALSFATTAAKAGYWVNFYSLEMAKEQLLRIQLSGESGVNRSAMRDGRLTEPDWNTINEATRDFEKLPIIWNDYKVTSSQIQSNTKKNRKKNRCDIVIIDYMGLITPNSKRSIREQEVAETSRTLKEIALNENVPVICLSQLNREEITGAPKLHHLRESGSIEQDADLVLFPWKENNEYKITVAKNRHGRVGTFEIFANDEMTVFGNKAPEISKPNNYHPDKHIEPKTSGEIPF